MSDSRKRVLPLLNVLGKHNAPAVEPPERLEFIRPRLADLVPQETAVIFYAYSAAAE